MKLRRECRGVDECTGLRGCNLFCKNQWLQNILHPHTGVHPCTPVHSRGFNGHFAGILALFFIQNPPFLDAVV